VKAEVTFSQFLGAGNPTAKAIPLLGSFDRATGTTRFAARVDQPIPLLSNDNETSGWGPIKQIYFKGATVSLVRGNAAIHVDGNVELRSFKIPSASWPKIDGSDGASIDFSGLEITVPSLKLSAPSWLKIGYPSLRLNFDGPGFSIGPLVLKLHSIGVDFGTQAMPPTPRFDWGSLVDLPDLPRLPENFPSLILGLRIELMKLPAILQASIERLSFDFTFGLWPDASGLKWSGANIAGGLSALGFDRLDLDLFRFIELRADRIGLRHEPDPSNAAKTIAWLDLDNVRVLILQRQFIEGLYAKIYVREGGSGFIGYLESPVGSDLFRIEWGLLGHNVGLPVAFAEQVLLPNPQDLSTADPNKASKQLAKEFEDTKFLPPIGGDDAQGRDWLIGAGISVASGFFQGRFLYQEGGLVGLALNGTLFEEWFGWNLAISVLYYRGGQPDQDRFYAALTIPKVLVGPIAFMSGVIAIEVYANGGFTLDVGFPWVLRTGGRDWNRTFGAILPPFQASGGLYFGRRNISARGDARGLENVVVVAGGYAVQAGLGAAFGADTFTVWVRIGLYTIIEGDIFLHERSRPQHAAAVGNQREFGLVALRLSGAFGVLFQGHAELNWWIISLSVQITLSAEAQATVLWIAESRYKALPGFAAVDPGELDLHFDFTVYASVSASACLRLGFFSVCAGISISVPLHAGYDLRLGHS
jgi:hypothetical protein